MKKLSFGKPVEMEMAWCDMCDEHKECFIGLTRITRMSYIKNDTKWEDVGNFFNPKFEHIIKDFHWEDEEKETTFHICPDCVKQLNSFIKEINKLNQQKNGVQE